MKTVWTKSCKDLAFKTNSVTSSESDRPDVKYTNTARTDLIDCLLVSPLDGGGGEDTLTELLLEFPPEGVRFISLDRAIADRRVRHSEWLRRAYRRLRQHRILPPDLGEQFILLESPFDLIFIHGFSVRVMSRRGIRVPPVVLRDPSGNSVYLESYLGWSHAKIRKNYLRRRLLYGALKMIDPMLDTSRCARLIVFSEAAKRVHLAWGHEKGKIKVIPPGFPPPSRRAIRSSNEVTFLFVGGTANNVLRKGGAEVLEAFVSLRRDFPKGRLIMVGDKPKEMNCLDHPSVRWAPRTTRQRLYDEFYPQADVFVSPTRAEGFGLAQIEAMSHGLPVITSNVFALPEIVEDGKTGFLVPPRDVTLLRARMQQLLADNHLRAEMGRRALERFSWKYSIDVTNRTLKKVFEEVLGTGDKLGNTFNDLPRNESARRGSSP